jgi:serine/threonine protein kinase
MANVTGAGTLSGAFYHPGQRLFRGRLVVRGVHGAGGMSVVYRAERRVGWRRHQVVALKVANPRRLTAEARALAEQRIAREAVLMQLAQSERVPRPLMTFAQHGRSHLVMEFVPGWTLERLLADPLLLRRPPWPEAHVLALGAALAAVLTSLHEGQTPLLVRDLKPANLIVTHLGHVMLVDLGIACPLRRGEQVPLSVRGLGTPGYASPEQIGGDGWEDDRSDLFALGAILFRTATGRVPYDNGSWREPPAARAWNPAISSGLEDLLRRLLHPDRARRPARAAEVSDVLRALHTGRSA